MEKYICRNFVFHDATVYPVGIGQMQDFQFRGAKSVIAEILMSIQGSVIIVIDWVYGTKETAFTARIWQHLIIPEQFFALPNYCSGELHICSINT